MSNTGPTLSVENYTIEQNSGGFVIFATSEEGGREWVASTSDPEMAMKIVEGLIMVEMKRFYHPDSKPVFKTTAGKTLPPFLKKGSEDA